MRSTPIAIAVAAAVVLGVSLLGGGVVAIADALSIEEQAARVTDVYGVNTESGKGIDLAEEGTAEDPGEEASATETEATATEEVTPDDPIDVSVEDALTKACSGPFDGRDPDGTAEELPSAPIDGTGDNDSFTGGDGTNDGDYDGGWNDDNGWDGGGDSDGWDGDGGGWGGDGGGWDGGDGWGGGDGGSWGGGGSH